MELVVFYVSPTQQKIKSIEDSFYNGLKKYYMMNKEQFYNECDSIAKVINTDSSLKKGFVIFLGTLFFIQQHTLPVSGKPIKGLAKIDAGGAMIFQILLKLGYWSLLASFVIGLIRWGVQQDLGGKKQALGSIGTFMGLYAGKAIFDFIVELFS